MKLPLNINPILKSTNILAHSLGIISANESKEEWFPWLCNKYVNCYYSKERTPIFDFYEYDRLFRNINLLQCQEFVIDTEKWPVFFNINELDFIQEIKKFISRGLYVWGTYNEKYIRAKNSIPEDRLGDYLLYGFDELGFYSAAHLPNGEYGEFIIPYHEYYQSVFQDQYTKVLLRFLRYNKEFKYEIDIVEIINELEHYIDSTSKRSIFSQEAIYGIDAISNVLKTLEEANEINEQLINLFYEFRWLMVERLKYMYTLGYVEKEIYNIYELINNDLFELCSLFRIPKENRNSINNNRIKIITTNMMNADKTILPIILSKIKRYNN